MDSVVITIGAVQAGTKENVIPGEALIKLNVRTFDETVRKRVLAAIERIVNAEAAASGATDPPEISTLDHYDLVTNDPEATRRIGNAFRHRHHAGPGGRLDSADQRAGKAVFGKDFCHWTSPALGCENRRANSRRT